MSQYETLRQVLEVENSIEDGCEVLLDKEQTLIRQGEQTYIPLHALCSGHLHVSAFTHATFLCVCT